MGLCSSAVFENQSKGRDSIGENGGGGVARLMFRVVSAVSAARDTAIAVALSPRRSQPLPPPPPHSMIVSVGVFVYERVVCNSVQRPGRRPVDLCNHP